MADFQSSKTAAEIEEVLTGALTYKSSQTLTETEKAFVREKIGATELGEGIKIVSHFDSLDELEAAVPNPNAGAAYSIGTELPYNLYVYDFYHDTWVNHGPIRANDITARFAQDAVVAVGAWEEDAEVFTDYTYKAAITLAEVTGNDFAIVAFSPSDAVGGNYAPICFAFDGYVEVWAKTIPTADIIIPAVTFIILDTEDGATGSSTKGITNASGGIATGGIDTSKLADGSVTAAKVAAGAVTRAKLAQDARYSPIIEITSDTTITVNHIGAHLLCNSGSNPLEVLIDDAALTAIPKGTEIAFIRWMSGMPTLRFSGGMTVVSEAEGSVLKAASTATCRLTWKYYGTFAIKKIYSTIVLVIGDVEVVE